MQIQVFGAPGSGIPPLQFLGKISTPAQGGALEGEKEKLDFFHLQQANWTPKKS